MTYRLTFFWRDLEAGLLIVFVPEIYLDQIDYRFLMIIFTLAEKRHNVSLLRVSDVSEC